MSPSPTSACIRMRVLVAVVLLALVGLGLAACASVPKPALTPRPTGQPVASSRGTPAAPPAVAAESAQACQPASTKPPDDASTPASKVIRTYHGAGGKTYSLVYGRGTGHQGDYGWAHIRNKHFYRIWFEGGPITAYPEAGICSESGVLDALGRALGEGKRQPQGDRATFTVALANARYELFVVAGEDGTVITGYPRQR